MREAEFRAWLQAEGYSPNTVNTQLAQSRRLDLAYGDLDMLHAQGGFPPLRSALAYSRADGRDGRDNPAKFPIQGDLYANLASYRASLTYYERFIGAGSAGLRIDHAALDALKRKFLAAFPDFEAAGGFTGSSAYHGEEDDYKRKLVDRVQELLSQSPPISDAELGAAILDGLVKDTNLLGYYKTVEHLKNIRRRHAGIFEQAAGALARSQQPPGAAAETFLAIVWPLLLEGSEASRPFGDTRIYASVIQALARPETAIAVIYQRFHNLGTALLGRSLFGNNILTAEEYETVLELARAIFTAMDGEWGWHPRDLWDVQGFVWVTCQQKLEGKDVGPAIDRSAAEAAMDECAELGEEAFVEKYGRSLRNVRYRVVRAGVRCPSKAIANAAYEIMHGERGSYGGGPARQVLAALGYEVVEGSEGSPRNGGASARQPSRATNLILYGPPGTGKTFQTAREAVRLCDGVADEDEDEVRERYAKLVEARQVHFVTFHQSYSYEQFVEGMQPKTDATEGGAAGFRLEPVPGVLRQVAALADEALKRASEGPRASAPLDLNGRRFWKMGLGAIGTEDHVYEAALAGNYVVLGWGGNVNWSGPEYERIEAVRDKWAQVAEPGNDAPSNVTQLWPFRAEMESGDVVIVPYGNTAFRAIGVVTGDYYYEEGEDGTYNHRRPVDWLLKLDNPLPLETIVEGKFTMRTLYKIAEQRIHWEALLRLIGAPTEAARTPGAPDQIVLIIDEINRANISKVFGELITLIEPEKRAGADYALEVQLPYSKTSFTLPPNLHIIGTMNTADRSIALLDTALRRRFDFREIMPRPDLLEPVEGIDLAAMLNRINERIEFLFDREHQIGHAYFIHCNSRDAIDQAMRHRVIPLLNEYFYEDWGKVALVLGDGAGDGETQDRKGAFLDRERLKPPAGFEADGDELQRWRWKVAETFDYSKIAAPGA